MPAPHDQPRIPAFVATTGGHLVQLRLMAPVLEPERHQDALWITHRTPQSESMLRDERVIFVAPVEARDWRSVLLRTPTVLGLLRRHRVDKVYSTGAALALCALPGARLVGALPRYIESLARSSGPSLAGRVLERVPWVPVFTQYPQNATARWRFEHSLLDSFEVQAAAAPRDPQRILVTLGTTRPWQFRSLVERMLQIAPAGAEIVWQTGCTDVDDLGIDARPMMSDAEFRDEIDRADLVVSHAGVGTFMRCLEAGKVPVLVPRRASRGEHVDDHQLQIATVGDSRGLAVMREVDALDADDLRLATSLRAARVVPGATTGDQPDRAGAPASAADLTTGAGL